VTPSPGLTCFGLIDRGVSDRRAQEIQQRGIVTRSRQSFLGGKMLLALSLAM